MRGTNIFTRLSRKIRAGNLLHVRRQVNSARGKEVMALYGRGDLNVALARKRAAEKNLAKQRKKVTQNRKKRSKK